MRTPIIASLAILVSTLATPADAQRLGRGQMIAPQIAVPPVGPMGGPPMLAPTVAPPQVNVPNIRRPLTPIQGQQWGQRAGQRWGGQIGGRWIGGVQAPGGWNAYRQPRRGFALPRYWFAPSFFIGNYASYGLAPPPFGFNWSRYYDDAVLIDGRGRVHDWVGNVAWDGDDSGFDDGYDVARHDYRDGHAHDGYAEDSRFGARYAPLGGGRYNQPYPPQGAVVQPLYPQGYTQSWSAGSGYWYPGGVTTTVTVQQAPVVTTTVTEYVEETVYRAPVRRSYRKPVRKWKPKPRCGCNCCR